MLNEDLITIRLECTSFFRNNPYTIETEKGVAVRMGRKVDQVSTVLSDLVNASILEKLGEGEHSLYRYIQPLHLDGTEVLCPSP